MKIAVVSTPWLSVPPKGYGGTERVVNYLTEGLVKCGHDVTLYATGDSHTSASLNYYYKKALGNDKNLKLDPLYMLDHIDYFFKEVNKDFDIVHYHTGKIGLYFFEYSDCPVVTTYHTPIGASLTSKDKGSLSPKSLEFLRRYKHYPFVSISYSQRKMLPDLNYIANVYNGIDIDKFSYFRNVLTLL